MSSLDKYLHLHLQFGLMIYDFEQSAVLEGHYVLASYSVVHYLDYSNVLLDYSR